MKQIPRLEKKNWIFAIPFFVLSILASSLTFFLPPFAIKPALIIILALGLVLLVLWLISLRKQTLPKNYWWYLLVITIIGIAFYYFTVSYRHKRNDKVIDYIQSHTAPSSGKN